MGHFSRILKYKNHDMYVDSSFMVHGFLESNAESIRNREKGCSHDTLAKNLGVDHAGTEEDQ